LQKLSLSLLVVGNLSVSCLSELKQLKSLSLKRCAPVGLSLLLQSIPSLRKLSLDTLKLPPGEQIASSSLQTPLMDVLSPSSSSFLSLSGLPALHSLTFTMLDLSGLENQGYNLIDTDLFRRNISKLAAFPLHFRTSMIIMAGIKNYALPILQALVHCVRHIYVCFI
jgi:hypothetical protein